MSQGKEVPCVFHCSPSGSSTFQILASLLEELDNLLLCVYFHVLMKFTLLSFSWMAMAADWNSQS